MNESKEPRKNRAGSKVASTEAVRRIRDSVHGTIDLSLLEDAVLGHWMTQRLRRVKQLAFLSYVFPCATHSRFEHSLGALHLASVAWERMAKNQKRLCDAAKGFPDFETRERQSADEGHRGAVHGLLAPTFPVMETIFGNANIFQALRLASLLHDIGHPPFSHSGERFLPTWSVMQRDCKRASPFLQEYIDKSIVRMEKSGRDPQKTRVRHEVFSLLLIDRIMNDILAERPELECGLTSRDICSIVTTDIEPAPGSPLREANVYRLCHELIAAELDIDRMDYLIRDSRECGVVYGIFDAPRILDSLCTYYNPDDQSLHLAVQFAGLAAFEDYLRARQSMYLQVYFHKTGVACEAALQFLMKRLEGWHLPCDLDEYAKIDEHNIDLILKAAAQEKFGSGREYVAFEQALADLTHRRRLWKRVFELTGVPPGQDAMVLLKKVRSLIEQHGIPCEQVSSTTSLTRLSPREDQAPSRNYMRLVKRDQLRCPRVVPIEDHSKLVGEKGGINIHRLYVPYSQNEHGEPYYKTVRELLISSNL